MMTEVSIVLVSCLFGLVGGVGLFFFDAFQERNAKKRQEAIASGKITFIKETK